MVADDDAMVAVGNIGGAERGAVCAVTCCNAVLYNAVRLGVTDLIPGAASETPDCGVLLL